MLNSYALSLGFSFLLLAQVSHGVKAAKWEDSECSISKSKITSEPKKLVADFVKADFQGEGMGSPALRDKNLVCPGYQGGADYFIVVRDYNILEVEMKPSSAIVKVQFNVIGNIMSGGTDGGFNKFESELKSEVVDFSLLKTPFGWRIDIVGNQIPRIGTKYASKFIPHRKWLPGDEMKFKEAIK